MYSAKAFKTCALHMLLMTGVALGKKWGYPSFPSSVFLLFLPAAQRPPLTLNYCVLLIKVKMKVTTAVNVLE